MKNVLHTLILLMIISSNCFSNNISNDSTKCEEVRPGKEKEIHFWLLRGLTREAGHWGTTSENKLKKYFPNAVVHYLDLPGAGKFHKVKAYSSVSKMVDFMRAYDQKNFTDTTKTNIILSSSLGGIVAMDWITRYPKDFDGAVLMSSSFKKICDFNERVQPEVRDEMFKTIFMRDVYKKENIVVKINSNDSSAWEARSVEWTNIQKKNPMKKINVIRQTIAGLRYVAPTTKPVIPILFLASRADRMVCVSCSEKISKEFGGTLRLTDKAGHSLPDDAPEWLVAEVGTWMTEKVLPQGELAVNN